MMRLLSLTLSLVLGLGGAALAQVNPPAPPVATPACVGGNSVIGYTAYGTPMVCGTALASGSIANGVSQLGVYIGTNSIGPLTPSGDVAFASPNFTVNSARGGNITIPNVTDTVALLVAAQTLTSKTINCAANTCTVRANLDLTGILAAANFPALTGDVTNAAGSLATTVARLQGRPISAIAPTTNQVLQWDGSAWTPGAAPNGGINQLTADVTAGPGIGSQAATIAPGAVTSGKMAAGAAAANVAALGGDLSGMLPAPVVAQFQGRPFASTAPTTNQLIGWNGSSWTPVDAPASGINQLSGDATAGPGTGSQPITLAASGVSAGSYQFGSYCATFDGKGRATSIVVATCGGGPGAAVLAMGSGNNCLSMGSSGLCLAMGH